MNDYQKALNMLYDHKLNKAMNPLATDTERSEAALLLRKLVHKATPMKPNRQDRYCGRCDINRLIKGNDNYCSICGQKIDWSDNNE